MNERDFGEIPAIRIVHMLAHGFRCKSCIGIKPANQSAIPPGVKVGRYRAGKLRFSSLPEDFWQRR